MDDALSKQIERVTDHQLKALGWSVEVMQDRIAFSSWVLALASAGLGAALLQGAKLVAQSAMHYQVAVSFLLLSVAFFSCSLISGGLAKRRGYAVILQLREMMTAYLTQCEELHARDGGGLNVASCIRQMNWVETLDDDAQRDFHAAYQVATEADRKWSFRMLSDAQQVFLLSGFLSLMAIAIPGPPSNALATPGVNQPAAPVNAP